MNNFKKFDLRLTSASQGSNLFEVQFNYSTDSFNFESFRDFLLNFSPFGSLAVEFVITYLRSFLFSDKTCIQLQENPFGYDIYLFAQKL